MQGDGVAQSPTEVPTSSQVEESRSHPKSHRGLAPRVLIGAPVSIESDGAGGWWCSLIVTEYAITGPDRRLLSANGGVGEKQCGTICIPQNTLQDPNSTLELRLLLHVQRRAFHESVRLFGFLEELPATARVAKQTQTNCKRCVTFKLLHASC